MRKVITRNYPQTVELSGLRKTEFGDPIFTEAPLNSLGLASKKRRRKHLITADATNFFDIQIVDEVRIVAGEYWIQGTAAFLEENVHEDDYVEFSIIDKDGVLLVPDTNITLFQAYGKTIGEDIIELDKFIYTDIVKCGDPAGGYHQQCFERVNGSDAVIPGLYFRIQYESYGNTNLKMVSRIYFHA